MKIQSHAVIKKENTNHKRLIVIIFINATDFSNSKKKFS